MHVAILKNALIFLAGFAVALLALYFYWQSNKVELAQKVTGSLASGEQCIRDTASESLDVVSAVESEEVFFVGCGGFF